MLETRLRVRSLLPFFFVALLPPALAGAATPTPPALRLDDTARPSRYRARIAVNPAEPQFQGTLDIELTIKRATDLLWLNATGLTITQASFVVSGKTIAARVVPGGDDFVGFGVAEKLPRGMAKLHIQYSGPITRTEDRGLFAQKEGESWYALTKFESIFARRVFPCFDEPSFKASWQLTLEVPEALTALSNTPVATEKREHAGTKAVSFAPTSPLSTYLIAFAVGPYDLVDAGRAGQKHTALRVAVPSGRSKDATYAATTSGKLLELLEQYFAIPFPYGKLDNVTIPLTTSYSAMENAGMVTYALNTIIAKPSNQGLRFERSYAHTAAHEYAHQWFGDLVTMDWWNDIWLNESFASWMEAKIIEQYKPEWDQHTASVLARGRALTVDGMTTARQVRQPILGNNDIFNAFDAITYAKGHALLAMFERYVGADKFRAGVQRYLRTHANGNATADDFIAAIGAAARMDLAAAWKSFLDQPGAPLVDVKLTCAEGKTATLELAQRRFLPVGSSGAADESWQIPLCMRYIEAGQTRRTCTLFSQPRATLSLGPTCPTWLLVNDEEVGYYRAAYPGDMLATLLGSDGRKQLSLPETIGLLDDVNALATAGRVPLGDVLAQVPSLAEDARRQVIDQAISFVQRIDQPLVQAKQRPGYARFIGKTFGARARSLGWVPRPGEDDDTRLVRPALVELVADQGQDAALRSEARALALKWLADRNAVAADVAGAVLHVAAHAGDRALFAAVHAEVKRANDRRDRQMLMRTLGDFRDPALARAALDVVGDAQLDARETVGILRAAAADNATRQLAWDYVKTHYDELAKRLPPESLSRLPYLAVGFCDEAHHADMAQFWKERAPQLPGGPRLLAQAEEAIELCRAYNAAQQPSVIAFLTRW